MTAKPRAPMLSAGLAQFCGRAVSLAAFALCATTVGAQVPSNERWQTLHTEHFNVHFTRPLESQARHAAAVAERAYANLARELVAPRGVVDLVLSDGTDASNGSATVIPRSQIVIFARPPVSDPSLESYDDWTVLVLQHELTHIFQLDRTRGWWRAAQYVFGRNPVLFPNYYTPAWLTEGLAVYYESRFTSGGRLEGTFQSAVARAAAVDDRVPKLGQLSLATTRFPYGESVYAYGSFVWEDLARRHGAAKIPEFVERSSAATIPFLLDYEAKRTFGESFTHAWDRWRDSALKAVDDSAARHLQAARSSLYFAAARARVIAPGGRLIQEPRWRDDSTLIYAANDGRESQGLYRTTISGRPERVARRNTLDVSVPLPSGVVVFAQGEYLDRLHTRGDLYETSASGEDRRLTVGARLAQPDARASGDVIAVQTVPAGTRLARVTRDGAHITPITSAPLDTQWTAPRWSPDGAHIAAIRIANGVSDIVVMKADGGAPTVVVRERAVIRSPTWSPDGSALLFTSDQSGISQLYAVAVTAGGSVSGAPVRYTSEPGGVFGLDVVRFGPDSLRVATTALRGDGYHVLVWTTPSAAAAPEGTRATMPATMAAHTRDPRWVVRDDTSRARGYSPWRTLVPAYWSPTFAQDAGRGALIGALTSAEDVIGRHAYVAQGAVNTRNGNVDASLVYSYSRWLNPVLSASLEQSWSYANIGSGGRKVGDLERRVRLASLHATFARPRARTFSALTIGGELEDRLYGANPVSLLPRLDPFFSMTHRYPALVASAVFSNTQRPTLSISPEDGVSLAGSVRQRWETSQGDAGRSAVAVATAYKSLDLPGFAHHVLALRVARGVSDRRSPSNYDVGGLSGSAFEIVPGISFGGATRTFPARGFAVASESGIYATSATAEYRIPLAAPSHGLGLFPVFLDRASLALFGDAARASCPVRSTPACSASGSDGPTLGSIGAELDLDSALQFDVPYRFRFGLAHPVSGATYAGASNVSAYVTLGATF